MNSTKENPLQFFLDFYQTGIVLHRNKFLWKDSNLKLSDVEVIEVNREEEFKKTVTWIGGAELVQTVYYKDFLQSKLLEESHKSKSLIKEEIKEISKTGNSFEYYLDVLLGELNELRSQIHNSKILTKYSCCIEAVYGITSFLLSNYSFENKNKKLQVITETITDEENKGKNIANKEKGVPSKEKNNKDEIYAFKWKSGGTAKTMLLYSCLKGLALQDSNESLTKLEKAFNGKSINEHVKLRWLLLKNRRFPKPSLIRVFHHLMNDLELLEAIDSSSLFAQTLERIFVGSKGEVIQNILNSLYDVKDVKPTGLEKKLIEKIDNAFISAKSS